MCHKILLKLPGCPTLGINQNRHQSPTMNFLCLAAVHLQEFLLFDASENIEKKSTNILMNSKEKRTKSVRQTCSRYYDQGQIWWSKHKSEVRDIKIKASENKLRNNFNVLGGFRLLFRSKYETENVQSSKCAFPSLMGWRQFLNIRYLLLQFSRLSFIAYKWDCV